MFGLLIFFTNGVDNVVPGKLADVYAAHLARINCGIRRSTAMGALVFLRLVDAWVVLLLAMLVPAWIPARGQQMIRAFHTGMWLPSSQLGPIIILTSLIWGLESVWTVSLAAAFGIKVRLMQGIFLTMIPLLASAVPLTPSGVGVVEVTMYSCLRLLDVSAATAAALTVVHRLIDYWLHLGVGALLWAFRRPIGLRTWFEASPPDAPGAQSSQHSLHEEMSYGA
jgi:hypothetical protein